jgi:hypothetical protein
VESAEDIAGESTAKSIVASASESLIEVKFLYLAVGALLACAGVSCGCANPLIMLLPSATIKIDLAALDAPGNGDSA